MNFADFGLGTWHPKNGMYSIVEAMVSLAKSLGVKIFLNSPVEEILLKKNKAIGIKIKNEKILSDIILSGADYHHTETLIPSNYRSYSESYWDNKVFAPSSLLFYIGIDKKVKNVSHHTLFFDVNFDTHASAIYDNAKWPDEPLFYLFQILTWHLKEKKHVLF